MQKVFISQPMRGKSEFQIKKERDAAIEAAKHVLGPGIEVIDSYIHDEETARNRPLWCLGRSLELLADADIAVFCPGWSEARGCRIENDAAGEYGIQRVYI